MPGGGVVNHNVPTFKRETFERPAGRHRLALLRTPGYARPVTGGSLQRNGSIDSGAFRDQSTALVIAGTAVILVGLCCALLVPLSAALGQLAEFSGDGSDSLRTTLPLMAFHAVLAAVFVWLGAGAVRARLWARDLILPVAKIWLLTGICTTAAAAILLPAVVRGLTVTAGVPPGFGLAVMLIAGGVLVLTQVAVPAALLLFFRRPDVAATCRARDPRPQLTDTCPPRLLTLAMVWALAALSVVLMPAYDFAFPLFGVLLRGGAGVLPWILVLVVCVALAWGTFRCAPWALRAGVVVTVAAMVSTVATTLVMGPAELLLALQPASSEIDVWAALPVPATWVVVLGWVVVWGSFVLYLLSLRHLFVDPGCRPGA